MNRDPVVLSAMRAAVRRAAACVGHVTHVPRVAPLDPTVFNAFARGGVPFVILGLVEHWPLAKLTPSSLREHFGHLQVKARHGDYVGDAFSKKRTTSEMSLAQYLDSMPLSTSDLPPYLGNQQLPELNALCKWPPYFKNYDAPRTWLGPANTVTPLHCDYMDNLFAQIWGRKRFVLYPPHSDIFLSLHEANPVLYASKFNPDDPNYEQFPLARQASPIECVVNPGEMLYLPAGWFHYVRALEDSLSSNRWSWETPMVMGPGRPP